MNSRIHLQVQVGLHLLSIFENAIDPFCVQASDVWDRDQIEEHLKNFEAELRNVLSEDFDKVEFKEASTKPLPVDSSVKEMHVQPLTTCSSLVLKDVHHDAYPFIDPSKLNLKDKVAFVSGASRGIGRALAVALARAGTSGVVIAARSSQMLEDVATAMKDAALAADKDIHVLEVVMDVLDDVSVQAAVSKTLTTFSKVDILFNVAGSMDGYAPFSSSNADDWWSAFTVNIRGTYLVTRALLPAMNLSEARGQTVINLVSNIAFIPTPMCSAYSVSFILWLLSSLNRLYR